MARSGEDRDFAGDLQMAESLKDTSLDPFARDPRTHSPQLMSIISFDIEI